MLNESEYSATGQNIIEETSLDFEVRQMSKRIAAISKVEMAMREDYITMMDKVLR
jgi:hypothetical protein